MACRTKVAKNLKAKFKTTDEAEEEYEMSFFEDVSSLRLSSTPQFYSYPWGESCLVAIKIEERKSELQREEQQLEEKKRTTATKGQRN